MDCGCLPHLPAAWALATVAATEPDLRCFMNAAARAAKDLVIANRILAHEGLVDAFGEVSVRHPSAKERFLLACGRSPGAVIPGDVVEFGLDGTPAGIDNHRELPGERFIHAAIYAARPDIKAVLHASPEDILPFSITRTPLRPVIGSVGDMGLTVPVWDIADRFGDATNLQVSTLEQGRDLARCLGQNRVVLLRGEGFVVTGRTLNDLVRLAAYIPRNGRTIVSATPFGSMVGISAGESAARLAIDPESNAMRRGWEYWARASGSDEWLAD
jgi:ribulose-5-phosphate 4-epimerase/fuculose-1-phosphate aldolase